MSDRIYPVPVKPSSRISAWSGWPDDVRDRLMKWNRTSGGRKLSFVRMGGVFKCVGCEAFCLPHTNGAARLDGDWICDDCLTERARDLPAAG